MDSLTRTAHRRAPATNGTRSSDAGPVMVQYQQMMRSNVDTQTEVMLSYLRVKGASANGTSTPPESVAADGGDRALPLVDDGGLRVADDGRLELVRVLDPTVDLYLDDHRLDGRPVFPAAMAMELMAEIAQCWRRDLEVVEISNFQLLRGIVLEDGPLPIRVVADPRAQTSHAGCGPSVGVEIFVDSQDPLPRYRGVVTLAGHLPDSRHIVPPSSADLAPFPLSVPESYAKWLFHGRLFEAITAIDGVSSQVLEARLVSSLPGECVARRPGCSWLIDPVVVDGSFQMAILWSRHHNDMTPLPSRFERYTRFGSLNQPNLRCVLSAGCTANGHTLKTRHLFLAEDGTVVGLLEGMESTCSRELNRLAGKTTRGGGNS